MYHFSITQETKTAKYIKAKISKNFYAFYLLNFKFPKNMFDKTVKFLFISVDF